MKTLGIILFCLAGGIVGLLTMGALLDADWSYAGVLATLAIGQLIVTVLVVVAYPETAHLELEALNPEDAPIDLHHLDAALPHPVETTDP